MPIYEYQCLQCGKEIEMIQKLSDSPLAICPDCGGKTEKKLSRASFQLKGSGWYADGYSSKAPPKKGDSKPAASDKPDSSAKTETSKTEAPKAEAPKTDHAAKPTKSE